MRINRRTRRSLGGLAAGAVAAATFAFGSPAGASTVVGQLYQHSNFAGAVLTQSVTPNGYVCTATTGDVDAQFASMPSGWNDVVSSFRGFSNCWVKIYENSNFGGASFGYAGSSSFVGSAMNDRTSSVRYS